MLIASGTMRGRCPVCGADRCTCGGPSASVAVDERVTAFRQVGPVSRFELRPGLYVRLTESEAIRRGLKRPEPKAEEPSENKQREPAPNKARHPRRIK